MAEPTNEQLEQWIERTAKELPVSSYAVWTIKLARDGLRMRRMEGWQPIESAPKDGTKIDLWSEHKEGGPHRIPDAYWNRKNWQLGTFAEHQFKHKHKITHWRPLPPPPDEKTK